MIKSIHTLLLALTIVPLFASKAASLEPIDPLASPAQMQELRGVWEGSWNSNEGDNGAFRLTIRNVGVSGYITGSRMYETEQFGSYDLGTEGDIIDGQLQLYDYNGKENWIKVRFYKDTETGQWWLKGRYSTVGGGEVYLGDIDVKKVSSLECLLCGMKMQNPDPAAGLDIDSTAKKMKEKWGEYAAVEAVVKANNSEGAGDLESKAVWLKIKARIEALQ